MNILYKKVNRYLIPIIIILIVIATFNYQMFILMLFLGIFEILVYTFLTLTIGKLIKNDLIAISFNLGLVLLSVGVPLKIMHWPNADLHLVLGKVLLIACLIIGCIIIFSKKI